MSSLGVILDPLKPCSAVHETCVLVIAQKVWVDKLSIILSPSLFLNAFSKLKRKAKATDKAKCPLLPGVIEHLRVFNLTVYKYMLFCPSSRDSVWVHLAP